MKPSVGRIVHYVAYNKTCMAAIVTALSDEEPDSIHAVIFISLRNVNDYITGGVQFLFNLPHDEADKKPGSWHWPERVE